MGRDRKPASVELTDQAKKRILQAPSWADFFRRAIATVAGNPEPDGLIRRPAPDGLPMYKDAILYDVYPWRIVYTWDEATNRVTVTAVEIHPTQLRFL